MLYNLPPLLLFDLHNTLLKRNWDVARLIWFQVAHSWWVSEPGIKLISPGPCPGLCSRKKGCLGQQSLLSITKPPFSLYLHPSAEYTSCKKGTQITYFYKACFPEMPVSRCPSSCHLCQSHHCKKRDRRSWTVYSGRRSIWDFSGNFVVGISCYFCG